MRLRFLAGLVGACVLAACAADNTLAGSVSELFPLDVSRVEVQRNPQAFQVSYYQNHGANVDLVARIAVALDGVNFTPGVTVPLKGEYAPGHQRATVTHLVSGEPVRIFPDVSQGELHLSSGGVPGQDTHGDFSVSFQQSGGFASGRTLSGTFHALALDAGYGP